MTPFSVGSRHTHSLGEHSLCSFAGLFLNLEMISLLISTDTSISEPGCSKLMTSLANVLLKFQKLIFQISQYFLLKKCENLLHCKSFSHFFNKKYQCVWL